MGYEIAEDRKRLGFAACAIISGIILLLAFQPWMTFPWDWSSHTWLAIENVSFSPRAVDGTEVRIMTPYGDGYLAAALAFLAAVLAGAAMRLPAVRLLSGAIIGVAGFTVFGMALYDILDPTSSHDFAGQLGFLAAFEPRGPQIEPSLWATLALSCVLGLVGTALSVAVSARPPAPSGDVPPADAVEAWT